jgi:hypothetical protein
VGIGWETLDLESKTLLRFNATPKQGRSPGQTQRQMPSLALSCGFLGGRLGVCFFSLKSLFDLRKITQSNSRSRDAHAKPHRAHCMRSASVRRCLSIAIKPNGSATRMVLFWARSP